MNSGTTHILHWQRHICLAGVAAAMGVIWLIVLPRLSTYAPMQTHLQWLKEQKVNPSAMYYTEVEALEPVLQRLNEQGRPKAVSTNH